MSNAQPGVSRRRIAQGIAWSVPAVVVASAAPAAALSCAATIRMTTTGVGGGGYDVLARDSKNANGTGNTSTTNTQVLTLTFEARGPLGLPLSGASVSVTPDSTLDGEGNHMVGFYPVSQTSGFGESPALNATTATTNASGLASVKMSTATYSRADCNGSTPLFPRSGLFTVTVSIPGCAPISQTFTYQVFDGPATTTC